MIFQAMFAIITPALIIGAFAERMKFSAFLIFTLLWATFVYDPVCHWMWGVGGWLKDMGVLDFAGGTVVHVNAGMAALVTALVIGKRTGIITNRCRRIICPLPSWVRRCSGSDGSGSTRGAPSAPTDWRSTPSL